MSMCMYTKLIRDSDDAHQKKVAAMQALIEIGEDAPPSLLKYFNIYEIGEFRPDSSGLIVKDENGAVVKWNDGDGKEGYEVDISKLPPGVVKIRFICSY